MVNGNTNKCEVYDTFCIFCCSTLNYVILLQAMPLLKMISCLRRYLIEIQHRIDCFQEITTSTKYVWNYLTVPNFISLCITAPSELHFWSVEP